MFKTPWWLYYTSCCSLTKYTSENTKEMMFFCFKSFISSLVHFKILLAHNVTPISRTQICLAKAACSGFHFFPVQYMSCFFIPMFLWLHLCLEVSLLDIKWKVYTFFPLSRSHLQRVLGVWLQYIHCSVVLVLTGWVVAFPRIFIGHCLILCKKKKTQIFQKCHICYGYTFWLLCTVFIVYLVIWNSCLKCKKI